MEEEKKSDDGNLLKKELWKKLPLKYKLIVIGVIGGFLFFIIFIVVMITPLMELGIIDIGDISSGGIIGNDYENFDSSTMWWPIGGEETVEDSQGNLISTGEPISTSITSYFGETSGRNHTHMGLDIGSLGLPKVYIIAASSGKVTYPGYGSPTNCPTTTNQSSPDATCGGGYGNFVKIEHNDGIVTLYGHMAPNSIIVKSGDTVRQGQIIGVMGSTGSSTGTHLHFEVQVNGAKVNPLNYISREDTRPI